MSIKKNPFANFLLAASIGIVLLFLTVLYIRNNIQTMTQENSSFSVSTNRSDSVWYWGSPLALDDARVSEVLTFCQERGIKTVYLEIDDYLLHSKSVDSSDKSIQLKKYDESLSKFISAASAVGIDVHALAGEMHWANTPHTSEPTILLEYVLRYNSSHTTQERFTGMHYDIEFHSLPDFSDKQVEYSTNYLALITEHIEIIKRSSSADTQFVLGLDIPFWFGAEATIPKISWNGSTNYLSYHILDALDTLPGSFIVLMDYRNYASGIDGSIEHADDEMQYAESNTPNAGVVVGQDTSDAQPSRTTFFGLPLQTFIYETDVIRGQFEGYSAFKGIAVHDFNSYRLLEVQ